MEFPWISTCSSFGPFWLDCLSLSRGVLCSNYCAKIWFLWFQIVCSNPQPFSWETTNLWNGCWKDSPCCWRPCGALRGCYCKAPGPPSTQRHTSWLYSCWALVPRNQLPASMRCAISARSPRLVPWILWDASTLRIFARLRLLFPIWRGAVGQQRDLTWRKSLQLCVAPSLLTRWVPWLAALLLLLAGASLAMYGFSFGWFGADLRVWIAWNDFCLVVSPFPQLNWWWLDTFWSQISVSASWACFVKLPQCDLHLGSVPIAYGVSQTGMTFALFCVCRWARFCACLVFLHFFSGVRWLVQLVLFRVAGCAVRSVW